MIDLHVHTNYSDGTWDLKKLLEEAEKAKPAEQVINFDDL